MTEVTQIASLRSGNAPSSVREGFSEKETTMVRADAATMALAAQAKAAVESRYVMAMHRPRNWDDVRVRLMKECHRPTFARTARYKKPIGKGVEGLSIRFVEAALRCMTNVLPEVFVVYDDAATKLVRVSVTDLEANITYTQEVTVNKTVERSKPSDDGTYISVRKNSYGKMTYTVPGTDDDILNKENALISKAMRTLGLRLIPGDLQDEAEATIIRVANDQAAKDPDAERKAVSDAFATLSVTPSMIEEYLGQPLSQVTPAQIVSLRALYSALREGEATWKTVMDNKREEEGKNPNKPKQKQTQDEAEAPPPSQTDAGFGEME